VFYTALGDWKETWKDPRCRTYLIEGIRWTMGLDGGKERPRAATSGLETWE